MHEARVGRARRGAGGPGAGDQLERGFTLIELLVVIMIIAVLAGLITTSVNIVRKRAKIAEARSEIANIQVALGAYNQEFNQYPGAFRPQPQDDPEALFRALYTGNPKHGGGRRSYLEDWQVQDIGLWPGAYLSDAGALYATPNDDQLNFSGGYTPCVLLDPWGRPYHYIEWDSFKRDQRSLPGGQLRAKGNTPVMIWSDGPNMKNDWGKEDDVTSWEGAS